MHQAVEWRQSHDINYAVDEQVLHLGRRGERRREQHELVAGGRVAVADVVCATARGASASRANPRGRAARTARRQHLVDCERHVLHGGVEQLEPAAPRARRSAESGACANARQTRRTGSSSWMRTCLRTHNAKGDRSDGTGQRGRLAVDHSGRNERRRPQHQRRPQQSSESEFGLDCWTVGLLDFLRCCVLL